jgi:cytochrome c oxidase cbb3-type subunit 1
VTAALPSEHVETVELRVRADASSRRPVLFFFATALLWLLLGSAFGEIASLKLHWPDLLVDRGWLTFGRIRTAHLNAMIYGWASLAMCGVSVWMIPRLVHHELVWPRLTVAGGVLWNTGLVVGVAGVLMGRTDGVEWLELDRALADPWLVVGGACVGVPLLVTVALRTVDHLYVSVWYLVGAFLWFPIIFVVGNWPFAGVESAAANWFYAHNALGLWLTAVNLAAVYYFIPKVLGRPIYSYQLSLLGFWTLAFFYALNGMHHLIGGPLPTWMITTSSVASGMMIVPVLAVAVNHHMSVVGRFSALRYSPTLRFVVIGAMSYTAVSLQGIFTALSEVNRITHFTQWTIAHSHVGVYGFVTFVLFGSIYYILPRVAEREWPSARLIQLHFWLSLGGIALYVVALVVVGVFQGLALLDPRVPFQRSVEVTLPGLYARSVAGAVLGVSHALFAGHCAWMVRSTSERRMPALLEARPVVVSDPRVASESAS